jgi:hypothetical protein
MKVGGRLRTPEFYSLVGNAWYYLERRLAGYIRAELYGEETNPGI